MFNFRYSVIFFVICLFTVMSYGNRPTTIKVGSIAPKGSPWDKALRDIASEWKKISKGKVRLKVYSGGVAGDEHDMLRKMKLNQLQGAAITGAGMKDLHRGVMAIQLPMLFKNDKELFYVLSKIRKKYETDLENKGYKVLTWSKIGWVHFFAKKPVVFPKDLQNQKIFTYSGDSESFDVYKELGFQPVPLSTNDILTSLQSGMIEAFSTTPLSAAAYQWFGLANNMTDLQWAPLLGAVIITMDSWNDIPKDIQDKLLQSADKIGTELQQSIDNSDNQAITTMKKHGLSVVPVTASARSEWEKLAVKGYTQLLGKSIDQQSYDLILQYLKEYRSK